MNIINFTCKKRNQYGKINSKKDRANGDIPAVVYGGQDEPINVLLNFRDIMAIYRKSDYKLNTLLNLDIDGQSVLVITKDIQQNPVSQSITHIDFMRVDESKPVDISVPVELKGTAKGQKLGGIVIQTLFEIKISCLPNQIPLALPVDITQLGLGHKFSVKDLTVNDETKVLSHGSIAIAHVEVPRSERANLAQEGSAEPEKESA